MWSSIGSVNLSIHWRLGDSPESLPVELWQLAQRDARPTADTQPVSVALRHPLLYMAKRASSTILRASSHRVVPPPPPSCANLPRVPKVFVVPLFHVEMIAAETRSWGSQYSSALHASRICGQCMDIFGATDVCMPSISGSRCWDACWAPRNGAPLKEGRVPSFQQHALPHPVPLDFSFVTACLTRANRLGVGPNTFIFVDLKILDTVHHLKSLGHGLLQTSPCN